MDWISMYWNDKGDKIDGPTLEIPHGSVAYTKWGELNLEIDSLEFNLLDGRLDFKKPLDFWLCVKQLEYQEGTCFILVKEGRYWCGLECFTSKDKLKEYRKMFGITGEWDHGYVTSNVDLSGKVFDTQMVLRRQDATGPNVVINIPKELILSDAEMYLGVADQTYEELLAFLEGHPGVPPNWIQRVMDTRYNWGG